MTLLEKLNDLKTKFINFRADKQDVEVIDGWVEQAKKLLLLQSLKNHDGVKYVIECFQTEIVKIDEALQKSYSKELPDRERDRLLDKKYLAQKYLSLFTDVDNQLERLESIVDKEMI